MSVSCNKCKMEGLHFKYYELQERYVLFENNEQPHLCAENPFDVQSSVDKFSQKFHSKIKKKIPIWCEMCNHFYDPYIVCDHIKATGFQEEIDDVTYFGSSYDQIELRKKRKREMKKLREFEQTSRKTHPLDLRDFIV